MADVNVVELKELYELSGYVKIISGRSLNLEKTVSQMEDVLVKSETDMNIIKKRVSVEIYELKEDVEILKSSVTDIQNLMIAMITQLKNTLKNDDFQRFEKRVDYWSPETRVSRREVRRIIKQI